jgi:hypothetical protein
VRGVIIRGIYRIGYRGGTLVSNSVAVQPQLRHKGFPMDGALVGVTASPPVLSLSLWIIKLNV